MSNPTPERAWLSEVIDKFRLAYKKYENFDNPPLHDAVPMFWLDDGEGKNNDHWVYKKGRIDIVFEGEQKGRTLF